MIEDLTRTILAHLHKCWSEPRFHACTRQVASRPTLRQVSKIWSANPLERVNAEIKRRTNVVGIFSNGVFVLRLVPAVFVD